MVVYYDKLEKLLNQTKFGQALLRMREHNPACSCCNSGSEVNRMINTEVYNLLGEDKLIRIANNDPEPETPPITCPECHEKEPERINYLGVCCRCQGTKICKDYSAWTAWDDNRYELCIDFYDPDGGQA